MWRMPGTRFRIPVRPVADARKHFLVAESGSLAQLRLLSCLPVQY